MADDDKDSKTEHPTPKRLEEAYEKGDVPYSREVTNFFILMIIAFTIGALSPDMLMQTKKLLAPFITDFDHMPADASGLGTLMFHTVLHSLVIIAIPVGCVVLAAVLSKHLQSGLRFYTETIFPKWSRVSPASGLKKLFSLRSLVEFFKSVVKVSVIGGVAYASVAPMMTLVKQLPDSSLLVMLGLLSSMCMKLLIAVLIAEFFIALFDFAYQRYEFMKSLRMTKQEIKDEYKQQEGDPKIKGKIRQIRRERIRKRMLNEVPTSDVVITNPTHFAVALRYDNKTMKAPEVTAKGQDLIALRIRQIAEENKVPVVENPPLARALFASTEIGEEVPTVHYEAVAKVISYVYNLKKKRL